MRIVDLASLTTVPILDYQSAHAGAVVIADGTGSSHIHWLRFEPGGMIGPHPAGFTQLLVPLEGSGWVAGSDGSRHPLSRGHLAIIAKHEVHSKGSDTGMSALMVQMSATPLMVR